MFQRIKNKPLRYGLIFIYFVIIGLCAIELNFLWLFGSSPTIKDIKTPNMQIASELYTSDGKLIGRYYKENRTPVEYEKIAPSLLDALVATEDVRFYKHSGVDFRSIISSTISTATGDKRGASTITQQLAKNLYSTRRKSRGLVKYIPVVRTLVYKIKEWITAFKIESKYSKKEIITLYLNTVPFGNNTFGIKTAAKKIFNKETDKLSVEESATLIGMLKATNTYNPIKSPEKSKERRNVVLSQMAKYDYITDAEYKKYSQRPLLVKTGEVQDDSKEDSYLRSAVARYLDKWAEDNNYDLYEDGLKIYTTIDSRLQKYAEEAVASQMKILQRRFDNIWSGKKPWKTLDGKEIEDFSMKAAKRLPYYDILKAKYKSQPDSIDYYLNRKKEMKVFSWDGGEKTVQFSTLDSLEYYGRLLNTGMMTLEPSTGKIKVWVGGIDHKYFKYDHVNQAKRQAGSTFKPFAYLTALEEGMSPCDKFVDKAVKIEYQYKGKTEYWEPKNADWNFTGREMSLRWAMGKSVNSITAQVTEKVGWDNVVKYAHLCGIESELEPVPSVSLGSNDVSVFEMVRAYSTFLNKGMKTEALLVERIEDNDGNLIKNFTPKTERSISEEIAWLMLYMFRGGMEEPGGTSQALWEWPNLWKKENQIGGKTGTSSEYVDGWYMGITKDLVTGVWVGCDERSAHFNSSESGEGSHTALPIFAKFMDKVYMDPNSGYAWGRFPKPEVEITRTYNCPTPVYKIDTAVVDSTFIDSSFIPDVDTTMQPSVPKEPVKIDIPQQKTQQPEKKETPKPATEIKPATATKEEPKTRKELREEKRKQKNGENI